MKTNAGIGPSVFLKILARLPVHEETWLGWGHTIDHGSCFDESTELCGSMLINPAGFGDFESVCRLPDGSEVNFTRLFRCIGRKWILKTEHDAKELLQQMDSRALIVDPKRYRFCSDKTLLS